MVLPEFPSTTGSEYTAAEPIELELLAKMAEVS